jgi:hypothetical protein
MELRLQLFDLLDLFDITDATILEKITNLPEKSGVISSVFARKFAMAFLQAATLRAPRLPECF